MERRQFMEAASAGRRLRVLVTSAVLFAVLAVTNAVIAPSGAQISGSRRAASP